MKPYKDIAMASSKSLISLSNFMFLLALAMPFVTVYARDIPENVPGMGRVKRQGSWWGSPATPEAGGEGGTASEGNSTQGPQPAADTTAVPADSGWSGWGFGGNVMSGLTGGVSGLAGGLTGGLIGAAPVEGDLTAGFWDWVEGQAGNVLVSGGSLAYTVGDKLTLGATSSLVDKAKDKAIDMALAHYADSMKRQASDSESVVPEHKSVGDGKVSKREAGGGPPVQTMIEEGQAADTDLRK